MSGFVIVVIAFIVLSNILRLAGKTGAAGKGTGAPRRTGSPRQPNAPTDPRRLPGGHAPADLAATMIPGELWRILTGQAPSAPLPSPAPAPRPAEPQLSLDDELGDNEEADIAAGRYAGEGASLETVASPGRPASAAAGRLAPAGTPAGSGAAAPATRGSPRAGTTPGSSAPRTSAPPRDRVRQLRRAIVLREVLGTPKGLE